MGQKRLPIPPAMITICRSFSFFIKHEKAREVLFGEQKVTMLIRREKEDAPDAQSQLCDSDAELYDLLSEVRSQLDRKSAIPPDVVLTNSTLAEMARKKPKNTSEFRRLPGVGELKTQWYAQAFLKELRRWRRENNL